MMNMRDIPDIFFNDVMATRLRELDVLSLPTLTRDDALLAFTQIKS